MQISDLRRRVYPFGSDAAGWTTSSANRCQRCWIIESYRGCWQV